MLKKFPTIYGLRNLITVFTRDRSYVLCSVTSISRHLHVQFSNTTRFSMTPHLRLGLVRGFLPSGSKTKLCIYIYIYIYRLNQTCWMSSPPHCPFYRSINISRIVKILEHETFRSSSYFIFSSSGVLLNNLIPTHSIKCPSLRMETGGGEDLIII
jgi:hypothetical protein